MNPPAGNVLGVDPGSVKAGFALVGADGAVLEAGIEPLAGLRARLGAVVAANPVAALALGRGTNAGSVAAALADLGLPVHLVDERDTTLQARALYFREHPPRGWRRLIPLGLQLPPRPIDDYAAILIARRLLAKGTG